MNKFRIVATLALMLGMISNSFSQACSDGQCPTSIHYTPGTNWNTPDLFELTGACPDLTVTWYLDTLDTIVAGPTLPYTFRNFGRLSITASFVDPDCNAPEGTNSIINELIVVCPNDISITSVGCNLIALEVNYAAENNILAYWEMPIGASSDSAVYELTTFGQQTFNVTLYSQTCGTYTAQAVYDAVECTESVCPEFLSIVENQECYSYAINLDPVPTIPSSITWRVNQQVVPNFNTSTYVFPGPGEYSVSATISNAFCYEETEVLEFITVVECDNSACPTVISQIENSICGSYSFFTEIEHSDESVIWSIDNTTFVGVGSLDYQFTHSGSYPVCMDYSSSTCTSGVQLCTELAVPMCSDEICTGAIIYDQPEPNHFVFSFVSVDDNVIVHWDFGDGTSTDTEGHVEHTYALGGYYLVTATLTDMDCSPMNITRTTVVFATGSAYICPTALIVSNPFCAEYQFSIEGAQPSASLIWDFGDGDVVTTQLSSINHSYSNGPQENILVTVSYSHPSCPSATFSTHFPLPNCNPTEICPEAFDLVSNSTCGNFSVGVSEVLPNQTFLWQSSSLPSIGGESQTTIQFAEAGDYTICLFTTTPECPTGTFICQEVTVPPCNYNCGLELFVSSQHCGGDAHMVATNMPSTAFLTWTVNGNVLGYGSTFDETYYPGEYLVCASYLYSDCTDAISNCTTLVIDTCASEICPQFIGTSTGETCGTYELNLSMGIIGESVNWTIDGIPQDEHSAYFIPELEGPQTYSICGEYSSVQCPSGVQLCAEIDALLCNDCPQSVDIVYQNCVDAIFQVGSITTASTVLWDFGDGTSFTSGAQAGHNYYGSDNYHVSAFYTSFVCPQGVNASVDINIVNCLPECLLPLTIDTQDCSTLQIHAVPTPSELPVAWLIDGVPSGEGEIRTFNLSPGPHAICATIVDDLCPSGYTKCKQVQIDNCAIGGCPQELFVTQLDSCQGYAFAVAGNGDSENIVWNFGDETVVEGVHNVQHYFPSGGTFPVSVTYSSDHCTDSATLTQTITVEACPIDCSIEVGLVSQSCEFISLEAITNAPSPVQWSIDEQTVASGNTFSTAISAGPHTIIATYNDVACIIDTQSATQQVNIEICTYPCSISLNPLTSDCETSDFDFSVSPPNTVVDWTANSAPISPSANNSLSLEAGAYNICVATNDPHCLAQANACASVMVEACPTFDCPTSLAIASLSECQSYSFSLGLPSGSVDWDFGDGTIVTDLSTISHHYLEAGTYTISAHYTSPECSVGTTIQQTITVVACPLPCTLSAQIAQQSCEFISLVATVEQPSDISWTVDNGASSSVGATFLSNLTAGSHTICAVYSNSSCEVPLTECFDVTILPCSANCTTVDFSVSNNSPIAVEYILEDETGGSVSSGVANLNGSTAISQSNCLASGCYHLVLTSTIGQLNSPQFLVNLTNGGSPITSVEEYTTADSLRILFGVNQTCVASPQCEITLQATEVEPCMFSFEAFGTPEVYPMHWDFGDGFTTDATWLYTHQFEPGNHTVCVMVEDEACGQVTACVDVSCSPPCSNVQLVLISDVTTGGTNGVAYTLTDSEGNVIPTDGFSSFDEQTTQGGFTACLVNGCYNILLDSSLPLDAGTGLIYNLLINGFSASGSLVTTTLDPYSMNLEFGVNTTCNPVEPFCSPEFGHSTTVNAGELAFSNSSSYNGDAVYFWNFGDGSTSTEISPTHVFPSNGTFTVCLSITTSLGCTNQICESILITNALSGCNTNSIDVTISGFYSTPGNDVLHLEIAPDQGVIFNSWTFTLADGQDTTISLCLPDLCYRMLLTKFGSDISADSLMMSSSVNGGQTSSVVITSSMMPYSYALGVNTICLGIDDFTDRSIHVYPNPATQFLTVASDFNVPMNVQIFDMTGRMISSSKSESNMHQIDINTFSNGVYQLRVIQGGEITQYKVEIIH